MTRVRRPPWMIAAAVALVVVGVLLIAEATLPAIATDRVRSSLHGDDVSVTIKASPALELLFGQADAVTIHARRLRPTGGRGLADLVARTSETDRLDATVDQLYTSALELDRVALRKRGRSLFARADVSESSIEGALPVQLHLSTTAEGSQTLIIDASANVLGHTIAAKLRAQVRAGKLEIAPDSAVGELVHVTVFGDPRVHVDSIAAAKHGTVYTFSAAGHLTG